ncbi:hypothetical protein FS749_008711, partial [Ceratobasidium sp. UAMH 11750]
MTTCVATLRRRTRDSPTQMQPLSLECMPEEVLDMVVRLLEHDDLYALIFVCRKLWRIASAWLWREVQGVHQLFWLMTRSWVESLEPTVKRNGIEVTPTRSELVNH